MCRYRINGRAVLVLAGRIGVIMLPIALLRIYRKANQQDDVFSRGHAKVPVENSRYNRSGLSYVIPNLLTVILCPCILGQSARCPISQTGIVITNQAQRDATRSSSVEQQGLGLIRRTYIVYFRWYLP